MKYEKLHLGEKYFDYKMLSSEYYEGIMFFNLMDKKIWTFASTDSVGLQEFYGKNISKYQWKERAVTTIYNSENKNVIEEIKAKIEAKETEGLSKKELEKHYNKNCLIITQINK